MSTFIQALQHGLRSSAKIGILLPLWISSLIIGFLQSWPIWTAGEQLSQRPYLGQFATGGLDILIDMFLDNEAFTQQAAIWLLMLVPLFMLQHVLYSFFAGGMLTAYLGKGQFWQNARRFWLAFIGLDLLLIVLSIIFIIPNAVLLGAGKENVLFFPTIILLLLLGIIMEYARAIAVVHERRNPFVLFGKAVSFCVRKFPGVLILALLATVALALLLATLSVIPGTPWLSVILQQLGILAMVWVKGLRLAWAGHYVQQAAQGQQAAAAGNAELVSTVV